MTMLFSDLRSLSSCWSRTTRGKQMSVDPDSMIPCRSWSLYIYPIQYFIDQLINKFHSFWAWFWRWGSWEMGGLILYIYIYINMYIYILYTPNPYILYAMSFQAMCSRTILLGKCLRSLLTFRTWFRNLPLSSPRLENLLLDKSCAGKIWSWWWCVTHRYLWQIIWDISIGR